MFSKLISSLFRKSKQNKLNVPMEVKVSNEQVVKKLSLPDLNSIPEPIIFNTESPKTLLIVNNTQGALELLDLNFQRILKADKVDIKSEYKIVICGGKLSGLIALKYIYQHHVDVALIDLVLTNFIEDDLAEFNSLDLADIIKKKNSHSKIAILSAIDLLKTRTREFKSKLDLSLKNIDACLMFSKLSSDRTVYNLLV